MLNLTKTTLKNGLRILEVPRTETKAMSLLFLVGTGSRYETKELNGISHFLEHILFKGTKKYPGAQILAEALDSIGASFNAYTSEEYTGFFIQAAATHFPLALEILHDMFYNPRFAVADVDREKGVIKEEINMYRDLPQRHVHDLIKNLIYGDTPLGRNIAGTHETVEGFSKHTFEDYQNSFYTPDNIIVAVSGNHGKSNWNKSISELFKPKTGQKDRNFEAVVDVQSEPRVLVEHKATDQTHLVIGLPAINETDPRVPTLIMLETILGGSMSSRLFNEIREKRGLAYYIHANRSGYHDAGYFDVSTGVRNSAAKDAVKVILAQMRKLKTTKIPPKELRKAKEHFKGSLSLGLEDSFSLANFFASQELYFGRQFQPEELIEEIEAVTANEIQELANAIFVKEKLNLAAVGAFKNEDFLPILEKSNL